MHTVWYELLREHTSVNILKGGIVNVLIVGIWAGVKGVVHPGVVEANWIDILLHISQHYLYLIWWEFAFGWKIVNLMKFFLIPILLVIVHNCVICLCVNYRGWLSTTTISTLTWMLSMKCLGIFLEGSFDKKLCLFNRNWLWLLEME